MIEGVDTSGIRPSFWFTDCKIAHFEPLKQNINAQICIIGAGMSGLMTAYQLCNEGMQVVLLEDGHLMSGETGRTSGHLTNMLDASYHDLERIYGEDGAKLIAKSHTIAIDTIENIVKVENIDCDFKRINGYLFLDPNDSISTLEQEQAAAIRSDIKVELLKDQHTKQFKIGPCLRFYNQARFHPLKYLTAIAKAIIKKGGKIFTLTHASEIKPGKIIKITTSERNIIKAEKLIIATNTPIFDKAMLFSKQEANRTYVLGFAINNKNLEDALYWDTSDPYHYLRLQKIDNQSILSVGGEDHHVGKEVNLKTILNRLEKWAKKTIPQLGEIKYYWSGEILEPIDHLAFIGSNPTEDKNIFVTTGYSGNGLTHGTIASILLTDQIMNRNNPWSEIYNPKRKPSKNLVSFAGHNVKAASQYMKYLTPGEKSDEKKIKPGEGAVIREGIKKIAIYKDKEGNIHRCFAVCTHMKGIVTWNALEKSWDCPLHGSRFTPFGEVMNGPANKALVKIKTEKKEKV